MFYFTIKLIAAAIFLCVWRQTQVFKVVPLLYAKNVREYVPSPCSYAIVLYR